MTKVKSFDQSQKESVGEILKILRVSNDMTMSDVAKEINISLSFLSEVERGKKNISTQKLEDLLKLYKFSKDKMSKLMDFHHKLILDKKSELKVYQLTLLKALKERDK